MNDFQQTFLRWLDCVRQDIVIQPLFDEFDRGRLLFRFKQIIPNIALLILPTGLRVDAYKREVDPLQPWDSLFKREACKWESRRFEDYYEEGFACVTENHDHRCYAPQQLPEAIFAEHCFEPLRHWIADTLAPAHFIVFADTDIGLSASLEVQDESDVMADEGGDIYEQFRIRIRLRGSPALNASLRGRDGRTK